jgi:hypothetical protein
MLECASRDHNGIDGRGQDEDDEEQAAWWTMKRMRYFMSDQTGDAFELFFDRSEPRLAGRGVGSGESAGHGGDETGASAR